MAEEGPTHGLGISLALVFATIAGVQCFFLFRSFRGNLAAAKASGLPYVIVPCVLNDLELICILLTRIVSMFCTFPGRLRISFFVRS